MTATTARGPIKALVVVTYVAMVAVNFSQCVAAQRPPHR